MTRINVIDPRMLSDKHLVAELHEITRPFNKVLRRMEIYGKDKALDNADIPESYVLGKGHETFFMDKLRWLYYRYQSLVSEMSMRGFNVNEEVCEMVCQSILDNLHGTKYWNDYKPTPEDMYLNFARLAKRSNMDKVLKELLDTHGTIV